MVEPSQNVVSSGMQGSSELGQFGKPGWDPGFDAIDHLVQQVLARLAVLGPVGVDDVLVDQPGDLDCCKIVVCEQGVQPGLLLLGEQGSPGTQGSSGLVQRVVTTAAFTGEFSLDTLPGGVELVAS